MRKWDGARIVACSWWFPVCHSEDTLHFVEPSLETLMNPNCFTDSTRPRQEVYQDSNRRSRCLTETKASLLLICVKWCHFLDQTVSHTVHKRAHSVAVLLVRLHSFPLESLRDSQLSVWLPVLQRRMCLHSDCCQVHRWDLKLDIFPCEMHTFVQQIWHPASTKLASWIFSAGSNPECDQI